MSTIATLVTRFTGDTGGLMKAIKDVGSNVSGLDKVFGGLSNNAKAGFAAAGAAGVAAGALIYKTGLDFQDSYRTIKRETGATGEQLDGLYGSMKKVYGQRPENMPEVTNAIIQLNRQSGLTGETLEKTATQTMRLAGITKTDLNSAIESSQKMMQSWGIQGKDQNKALDGLYVAFSKTGIPVNKLADDMARHGPVMRAAGMSYGESAGMLGLMHKAGVDAGPVMMALSRSIKEAASQGKDANTFLRETFDTIKNAQDPIQSTQTAIDVFGARAGPRLAQLIREGKLEFGDLAKEIDNADGSIKDAASGTSTASAQMKIAWHNVQLAIEPIAKPLADIVRSVAEFAAKAMQLGPVQPIVMGLVVAFATFAVVLGLTKIAMAAYAITQMAAFWPILAVVGAVVLLIAVFMALKGPLGTIPALLIAIAVVLGIVGAAILIFGIVSGAGWALALWPIFLIIAAIALLAAGIYLLIDNWDFLWTWMKRIAGWIASAFMAAWNGLVTFFTETLPGAIAAVVSWFAQLPGRIWNALTSLVPILWNAFKTAWDKAWEAMVTVWGAVWGFVVSIPGRIWDGLSALWGVISNAFRNAWNAGWEATQNVWSSIWGFITSIPGRIWDGLSALASTLWNAFKTAWDRGKEAVTDGINTVVNFFKELPGKAFEAIKSMGSKLLDAGKVLAANLAKGISSLLGKIPFVGGKMKDFMDKAIDAYLPGSRAKKGPFSRRSPAEVGEKIATDIAVGLTQGIDTVAAAAAQLSGAAMVTAPGVVMPGPVAAAPVPIAAPAPVISAAPPALAPTPTAAVPDASGFVDFAADVGESFAVSGEAAHGFAADLEHVTESNGLALTVQAETTQAFATGTVDTWAQMADGVTSVEANKNLAVLDMQTATSGAVMANEQATSDAVVATKAAEATAVSTIAFAQAVDVISSTQAMSDNVTAITGWMGWNTEQTFADMGSSASYQAGLMSGNVQNNLQGMSDGVAHIVGWMSWYTNSQIDEMGNTANSRIGQLSGDIGSQMQGMSDNVSSIVGWMCWDFDNNMRHLKDSGWWGGNQTSSGLQTQLAGATPEVTRITQDYSRELKKSLDPILEGVGKDGIRLPFQRGGEVPGLNHGRDEVYAVLQPGEYVVSRNAAMRLGYGALDKLNYGWSSDPRAVLPAHYQEGGVVAVSDAIRNQFRGLRVTSGMRPGDTGYHGRGMAIDLAGSVGEMMAAARWINESGMWKGLTEGIFNPGLSVKNGAQVPPGFWGGGTWANHADHLHIAVSGEAFGMVQLPSLTDEQRQALQKFAKLGEAYEGYADHVRDLAQEWVDENAIPDFGEAGAPPAQVAAWIGQAMQIAGVSGAAWATMLSRKVMQESGGRPGITQQIRDVNSGGNEAVGLMQIIPATFARYRNPSLPDDRRHPIANLVAAIAYIQGRYGGPAGVPASNGYARGGIVPSTPGGRSILAGEGGRDEAIVPLPRGWRSAMSSRDEERSSSSAAVHIENYHATEEADVTVLMRKAEFTVRAGRI